MSPVVRPPCEARRTVARAAASSCGRGHGAAVAVDAWRPVTGRPSEERRHRRHHAEQQEGGQQAHAERHRGGHARPAGPRPRPVRRDSRSSSSARRSTAWTTDAPETCERTIARPSGASASSSATTAQASVAGRRPSGPAPRPAPAGRPPGPGSAAHTCARPATGSAPARSVEANRSTRWGRVRSHLLALSADAGASARGRAPARRAPSPRLPPEARVAPPTNSQAPTPTPRTATRAPAGAGRGPGARRPVARRHPAQDRPRQAEDADPDHGAAARSAKRSIHQSPQADEAERRSARQSQPTGVASRNVHGSEPAPDPITSTASGRQATSRAVARAEASSESTSRLVRRRARRPAGRALERGGQPVSGVLRHLPGPRHPRGGRPRRAARLPAGAAHRGRPLRGASPRPPRPAVATARLAGSQGGAGRPSGRELGGQQVAHLQHGRLVRARPPAGGASTGTPTRPARTRSDQDPAAAACPTPTAPSATTAAADQQGSDPGAHHADRPEPCGQRARGRSAHHPVRLEGRRGPERRPVRTRPARARRAPGSAAARRDPGRGG